VKIGLDIMGGDYAPKETLLGAIQALSEVEEDSEIVLIGSQEIIEKKLSEEGADASSFTIINTSQIIEMGEHPTRALQQKPDSSISVGFKMLSEGKLDSFASAGNSGAMMVGAMFTIKPIPGVLRPSITSVLPKEDGSVGVILDVGINADCKPEVLAQFATLGSLFTKFVHNIENPKVALLNIGEEAEKGSILTQSAFNLIKANESINFVGNVEGRDLFNKKADVIVCDGFTGNVVLKQAESFFRMMYKRGLLDDYFKRFNYENYGGTPILGVNGNVIVGHGISNATAIKNMILLSQEVIKAKLPEKIKQALS
jgi:phosphate acyltransferase